MPNIWLEIQFGSLELAYDFELLRCFYSVGYHVCLALCYLEVWLVKLEFASRDSRFPAQLEPNFVRYIQWIQSQRIFIYIASTDGQCRQPQLVVANM